MISDAINNLYKENDQPWSGFLYRAGEKGLFYHTDAIGASYYQKSHGQVSVYECPNVSNFLLLDVDSESRRIKLVDGVPTVGLGYIAMLQQVSIDDLLDDDWVFAMEDSLPQIFDKFDAMIIYGDTGSDVLGFPVEVVLKTPLNPSSDPKALATLID